MSTSFWIVMGVVVGAIILISLITALTLGYFVATKSRSRKMASEQASLNKKTGASDETLTATSSALPTGGKSGKEWLMKHLWAVRLVIGMMVLFIGIWLWPSETSSMKSPTPSGVWQFFRDYWFWIVLVLVGLYFWFDGMTPAPAWAKGAKGMVVASAVLMVGAMAVHGIWGESSSSQQAQLARPLLKMPANGDSSRISPRAGEIIIFTGSGFEHHVVYADGKDCVVGNQVSPCKDGPILYQYVRDTTCKPNRLTYQIVL